MSPNKNITTTPVTDLDFPALFQSSDKESQRAGHMYNRFVWLDLIFIYLGAFATSVAVEITEIRTILAILGAVSLGSGTFITTLLNINKYDKHWFGGRALAESIKTVSWRYMMGASPYDYGLALRKVDELFINEIKSILNENNFIGGGLALVGQVGDQITDKMRKIRALPVQKRKLVYIKYRIENQEQWYAKKADSNKNNAEKWFQWVILIQFLALIAAIILVSLPGLIFNAASVLSTVATALIAWIQVKRYQDLSHAYGLASQELALIHSLAIHITSDEELSRFVMDSENAISREHTMWLARRDTL